jgi:glycosyltransferase involved in cell wall biosynthesis
MKICFLTARFPFPQYGGGALRINEIARYLKSQGHELVLVSLLDYPTPALEEASRIYDRIYYTKRNAKTSYLHCVMNVFKMKPMQCGYYYSNDYRKLLKNVIFQEKPDLFIPHILRMVPYIEELRLEKRSIVEMTDALSKSYAQSIHAKGVGFKKIIFYLEHFLIRRYEKHVIRRFPKIILVSQADVDYLQTLDSTIPTNNLYVHANGVKSMDVVPGKYDSNKICFIGSMNYLPNQDAVSYIVKEIFPIIKKRVPTAKLHIVGSLPPPNIQALASGDVIVTGFVQDLEVYIADSCLALAPIRVASGIQNKVLISMGCGLPVVLTSLIAKAIPELEDGINSIIRDDATDIADECVRLIQNKELREMISRNGYEMVCRHYSWKEKLSGYEVL